MSTCDRRLAKALARVIEDTYEIFSESTRKRAVAMELERGGLAGWVGFATPK